MFPSHRAWCHNLITWYYCILLKATLNKTTFRYMGSHVTRLKRENALVELFPMSEIFNSSISWYKLSNLRFILQSFEILFDFRVTMSNQLKCTDEIFKQTLESFQEAGEKWMQGRQQNEVRHNQTHLEFFHLCSHSLLISSSPDILVAALFESLIFKNRLPWKFFRHTNSWICLWIVLLYVKLL